MKAQRGKIIVLCLCLIFAMLIISGKASKLGTYLYVRCNYTHLEEFAAEVIQTGAIPDAVSYTHLTLPTSDLV